MDKPLEPGVRKKGRNTYQVSTEYLKEDFEKMGPEKFKQLMKNKKPQTMKKGGLSAGQKKIAAKAPPPDKIDAKDFAVLKKEKAKGRGMGLQDESIKPGKVMKAREGKMFKGYSKVFETGAEHGAKGKQPSTIVGVKPNVGKKVASKIPGRIGKTLGVVSMLVPAAYAAAKQYKDYKSAKNRDKAKVKKMGGGMMKKYSKGGGADSGRIGEMKSRLAVAADRVDSFRKARGKVSPRDYDKITERTKTYALAQSMKDKDRLTDRDIKKASSLVKGKMGGGMMQKPMGYRSGGHYDDKNKNVVKHIRVKKKMGGGMIGPSQTPGYSKGTMVKARGCKLGRTRPTKIT